MTQIEVFKNVRETSESDGTDRTDEGSLKVAIPSSPSTTIEDTSPYGDDEATQALRVQGQITHSLPYEPNIKFIKFHSGQPCLNSNSEISVSSKYSFAVFDDNICYLMLAHKASAKECSNYLFPTEPTSYIFNLWETVKCLDGDLIQFDDRLERESLTTDVIRFCQLEARCPSLSKAYAAQNRGDDFEWIFQLDECWNRLGNREDLLEIMPLSHLFKKSIKSIKEIYRST